MGKRGIPEYDIVSEEVVISKPTKECKCIRETKNLTCSKHN